MARSWVFFDVGGPIYDEDENVRDYYDQIRKHFHVSRDDLEAARQEAKKARATSRYWFVVEKFAGGREAAEKAHAEIRLKRKGAALNRLQQGLFECLDYLKKKGYKLGIIANQPASIRQKLEEDGVLKYFEVVIISEEVGTRKPERHIFEMALEKAHCEPADAWFVGDRVDNDLKPAKAMGMKTVRLRVGWDYADEEPQSSDEKPDCEIKSLVELKGLL